MSQQLWWLLRGVVDCGACDVVLAQRLGCCRGLGIASAVGCYCCCRPVWQWNTEDSFLTANGNKPLIPFSECQCPERIDGNTVLQVEWKGPAVTRCKSLLCLHRSFAKRNGTQHAAWRINAGKQDVSMPRCWLDFFLRFLLNWLTPILDFRGFCCPVTCSL